MPLTAFGTVRLDQSRNADVHKTRILKNTRVRNPDNREEVFGYASDIEEVVANFQVPAKHAERRARLLTVARGLSQKRLRRMQIAAEALNGRFSWVEDESAVNLRTAPRPSDLPGEQNGRVFMVEIAREFFAHFKPIHEEIEQVCNERLPRRRIR